MWLNDLMDSMGISVSDSADNQAVFTTAYQNGIIKNVGEQPYSALTRRYAAQTLANALGYQERQISGINDLTYSDTALATLVYYGYFTSDDNEMVYPDAAITGDEYHRLLDEVRRYRYMRGKKILSFGDSIMFGKGNRDIGIADMTAEKYGMTAMDYSVSGATFGVCAGRSQIASQIQSAAKQNIKPDMILINGGTNDMDFLDRGEAATGYQEKNIDKKTYAGGFEYAALLLQQYWPDVPVIYIRAHDMDTVDDVTEQLYGELAITLAEKWHLYCVDVYDDTDFCTELSDIRDAYTIYKEKLGNSDGIHPNALGYAKYYLPLISAEIGAIFDQA